MGKAVGQRENAIERYLLRMCRENGLLCMKFVSPGRAGVPDRIVVSPITGVVFVEVKRTAGRLGARQSRMHSKLRHFGAAVHVVDDEAGVDTLVEHLRGQCHSRLSVKA
ncbi:VRR-NUC domain-containing protein [Amycolatopsis sp. TNS106]|uniref:VRR-NUC domain-containing protein n=1 Tax=Amycolatopsis sp. TNS106 TaxID=2861750 RepID=UPI001C581534|nr:VRR-NUC domain-containing protein [Amycolatopsis sp. TNS106]QXV57412.1 hypothetical protein CVV72_10690 [Amycolatopsis sp. TNS106]